MARRSCSTAINTSPLISVLLGDADDQRGAGCFDDIIGDGGQLVDLHDPLHLGEQPVDEAEVAAGDPGDRGDGLGVGEVFGVEVLAEGAPPAFEDEDQFFLSQGAVFMREADPAVELGSRWPGPEAAGNSPHL